VIYAARPATAQDDAIFNYLAEKAYFRPCATPDDRERPVTRASDSSPADAVCSVGRGRPALCLVVVGGRSIDQDDPNYPD